MPRRLASVEVPISLKPVLALDLERTLIDDAPIRPWDGGLDSELERVKSVLCDYLDLPIQV